MTPDIDKLERLAEAAKKTKLGALPWKWQRQSHGWHIGPQPEGVCSMWANSGGYGWDEQETLAEHIAAADPTTILSMIAELRRQASEIERLKG